jgi:putative nucleotidyltransferase with HDIG domain
LAPDTVALQTSTSLVGKQIAGYRLVTELRSGGMGTVYYAEHQVIGRRAAIKILHPEVASSPQIIERFHTEARAANNIHHPNVVEITDLGTCDGLYYIVMSFLEGETLGERLERERPLDEATVIRITRQIASALGAAHERGIVHRDLKPENVFLLNHPDYPDYVKVLDFGIAKLIGAQPNAGPHLTEMGTVVGTPAYMSPEQCRANAQLDHRSDVYSLGVMLFEMLTGRVPFIAASTMDVMMAHLQEKPVAPIDLNPKISPHINALILRALEKDPAKRFDNMLDLRRALEHKPDLPAGIDPETFEKRERREASFVVDRLSQIILDRLEKDKLLIPSMPVVATQCMGILEDPNQTFAAVGNLVGKDPVLASRVLRLANSAAFPGKSQVTTLDQAIARMGTEGLKLALINYAMYQAFSSRDERIQAAFRGIWEHSLAVALIARELSVRLKPPSPLEPGTAYLAGLLHDVGKPVVGALLLEAEKLISTKEAAFNWISHGVWKRVVAGSHRRVGTGLARKWNLPAAIVRAIEFSNSLDENDPVSFSNLVCLANAFAKQQGLYAGDVDQGENDELVAKGKQMLGLADEVLAQVAAGLYERVGTLFDLKPAVKRTPAST